MLALPVDCLRDFGPRGLSVPYTQDACGCLPAHTGRPWLFVAVLQHTHDVSGCLCVSVCVRQDTQDVPGCLCVSVCVCQHTQASVGVRQHTQDVRVCLLAHTGRPWMSVCSSAHTGRL